MLCKLVFSGVRSDLSVPVFLAGRRRRRSAGNDENRYVRNVICMLNHSTLSSSFMR